MINTVIDYLTNSYRNYPDKAAIVYNGISTSYETLYHKTLKAAKWINEHIQTGKKPIIVMMKNSDKAIEAFLGVALSGNIYVPLDIDTPVERLNTIIEILHPVCIINCEDNEPIQTADVTMASWSTIQKNEGGNKEERNHRYGSIIYSFYIGLNRNSQRGCHKPPVRN